ncbi:uncharacterized conserved protein, putative [Plesiocystis pacifica SIR-1]|uniref:Uncharacterized conserved protein, putative n=1 Tax=Plesiocystis pacifica SIR-1 TaxID=391625 RepID=A6G9S8_9BACT|nr:DUF434 domain-containing protein [Plesiocystis pacifica]EDM77364.1 uncharacterized conserved protein, putative [Plesiocystis pacifica SIR-1]
MPRGPAQDDAVDFGAEALPGLRTAVSELAWLLSRGYATTSALELVGNRHDLRARQRTAVLRCTCTDDEAEARTARRVGAAQLRGRAVALDGFNVLIAVESALAGGVVLRGRDGALRDMASVHGSYRRSETTQAAAEAIGEQLAALGPSAVLWLLDRPVSNSGRLKVSLAELAQARGWPWTIELDFDPDKRLAQLGGEGASASPPPVVASGDGWILDRVDASFDLAAHTIAAARPDAWLLDLGLL